MKLSVTIVIVITLYLVGELPAHLTSRKSVVNLVYGGDVTKINFDTMQKLEVICITLNAIQLSINIIIYAAINPCFVPEFFNCLKDASQVCFRFMAIRFFGRCWQKICNFKENKKKYTKTGNRNIINQKLNISIICKKDHKQSFDNPTFSPDVGY